MSRPFTLEQRLERIADIKRELKHYDALKIELDELKFGIMLDMQATKSKRTEPVNGYFAVRAERVDVKVTNDYDVENWLEENGFTMDEYKRLDLTRVTPLVKTALKENGELVPGTELVTNEYITIKEAA